MIGAARPEDKAAVMEVYRACFPGEEGFCRFFFDNVYRPDNTLVCRVEGKLAASVQLLPVVCASAGLSCRQLTFTRRGRCRNFAAAA